MAREIDVALAHAKADLKEKQRLEKKRLLGGKALEQ
jgi:hypothetical protein